MSSAVKTRVQEPQRPSKSAGGEPRLLILECPDPKVVGTAIPLDRPLITLGRADEEAVKFEDEGVSRHHAKVIRLADNTFRLLDLGSTNGTVVNGRKVATAVLNEGDVIHLGERVALKFTTQRMDAPEDKLRQLVASARLGTWELELSTRKVLWSSYVEGLFHLPAGALTQDGGAPLESFVYEADRPRVTAALAQLAQGASAWSLELRLVVGKAEPLWVALEGAVTPRQSGPPQRASGTVLDIHVRKRQELELRRQALLFDSLLEGVVLIDLKGNILDWNASAQGMFGFSKDEVMGRPLWDVVSGPTPSALNPQVLSLLQTEARWSGEGAFLTKDGKERFYEATLAPLRDVDGSAYALVAVHRDITEKKQLQTRLAVSERLASIGTLSAGVAHEINNPLSYVLANLTSLSAGMEDLAGYVEPVHFNSLQQLVAETREGASRIRDIVKELSVLSRAPAEGRPSCDLNRVLRFVLKVANLELRYRARTVVELADLPPVAASESKLSQVLLNLIMNAAQAIPEGHPERHEVRIRTRLLPGDAVECEVSDTGCGIAPADLGRIFDPFFTTKPVGKGTGLGLSVCHALVTSFKGDITVQSEQGKGTTFRVMLPVDTSNPFDLDAAAALLTPSRRSRVLIVDDEANVANAVQRLLAQDHQVVVATSGPEALEQLRGQDFDIILCDVMMPGMTGLELHGVIEERHPAHAERMYFMTGGVFSDSTLKFLERIPQRSLLKPLDEEKLRTLVARAPEFR